MRRWVVAIIGVLLGASMVMLGGCGGSSDGPAAPANDAQATSFSVQSDGHVRVLIGFKRAPGRSDQNLVRGLGGNVRHTYHLVAGMAATLPAQAIEALKKNPNVAFVEPDATVMATPEDQPPTIPWGVDRVGAIDAHGDGHTGAGQTVAIIDSGIDYTHPDLDLNYAGGKDFINGGDVPMDDYGHGTHVAGIVATEHNEFGVVGVAPQASLYALKVLDATGLGYDSDVIAALQWCVANEIDVANMSFGGDAGSTLLKEACDKAYGIDENGVLDGSRVLLVAASGNDGRRNLGRDTVDYPAQYATVIAVGATDWGDNRTTWSSSGPALELAAPGNNIFSTYLVGGGDPTGYATMSGTSMAAPHVAGAAALVMEATERNAADTRELLRSTAKDLGATDWDPAYGYGFVDVAAALGGAVNQPPVASASADPTSGALPLTVEFDGEGSFDPDGTIVSYDWDFGDGSTASEVVVSHTYENDGTYIATLTVTDDEDATDNATITITVVGSGSSALVVEVATDKGVYADRETVRITVTVTDGSSAAVPGASVHVVITNPNGSSATRDGTTGSTGVAILSYRINTRKTGVEEAEVVATASAAGYTDGASEPYFFTID